MIRLFPFACTSSVGEAVLIIDAPTIRSINAGQRLTVRPATSTHIMPVPRARRNGLIRDIIAKSDQAFPCLLLPDTTRELSCLSTAGLDHAIMASNAITGLAWVTRPAKKNFLSRV